MPEFEHALKDILRGELRTDLTSRGAYSVDSSIYEIVPQAIAIPRDQDDLRAALRIAHQYGVSVTPRGAATGIAGGAIGPGLILDTAKHLNKILSIDLEAETATIEPGVVQDQLNDALAPHGYRFGPDTSTGNRATIGGMVGNNSSGAHSLRYGRTVEHLLAVKLLLDDGSELNLSDVDESALPAKCAQEDREGEIYRSICALRENYKDEIRDNFPRHRRRASGFNLDELIKPGPLNLAKLIAGSEGALGVVSEITVRIVKKPAATSLVVLQFEDLVEALSYSPRLKAFDPYALEVLDHHIIEMGRLSPSMRGRLNWLEGEPGALLMVECDASSESEALSAAQQIVDSTEREGIGYARLLTTDVKEMADVWALRKAGLGLLQARRSYARGVAFIEDLSVPAEHLPAVVGAIREQLSERKLEVGIYGHAGPGCIHMRPFVNMTETSDLKLMEELMNTLLRLVTKHDGVLSGEHGDGYLRSWQNEALFGPILYQAFKDLKTLFDPDGRMNPGKVIPTQGFRENLRIDDQTQQREIQTAYDWSSQGGFALSVDMCNGNGQCRKRDGHMCPSFHASGDERETTRARAQTLRTIINGRVPLSEWTGKGLYDILDLCIECKGCKKECPSQVDMAKMKSEFLYHYQKEHGVPFRSRLFGALPTLSRFGVATAPLSNWLSRLAPSRWLLSLAGIAPERTLPAFATERFSRWFAKRGVVQGERDVVLLNDTYTEHNNPEIGHSAVAILEALGYTVHVPPYRCCGRPLISKGLLDKAKKRATQLVDTLRPHAEANRTIVGLEPSCILSLRDEYPALIPSELAEKIAGLSVSLDEFLAKHVDSGELALAITQQRALDIHLHGHCHQKAIVGNKPTMKVLEALPGATVQEIPSGCCGMAGSFGYEKEHYDFSQKVGETQLFPYLRKCDREAVVVASGISCRHQVSHGVERDALHLAQLVARWL